MAFIHGKNKLSWELVEEFNENGGTITIKRHLTKGEIDNKRFDLSIAAKGIFVTIEGKTYMVSLRDFICDAYLKHSDIQKLRPKEES